MTGMENYCWDRRCDMQHVGQNQRTKGMLELLWRCQQGGGNRLDGREGGGNLKEVS